MPSLWSNKIGHVVLLAERIQNTVNTFVMLLLTLTFILYQHLHWVFHVLRRYEFTTALLSIHIEEIAIAKALIDIDIDIVSSKVPSTHGIVAIPASRYQIMASPENLLRSINLQ